MFFIPTERCGRKAKQSSAPPTSQPSTQQPSQWNIDVSIPTKKCLNDFWYIRVGGNSPIHNWYSWNVNSWTGADRNRDITGQDGSGSARLCVFVCACMCVCGFAILLCMVLNTDIAHIRCLKACSPPFGFLCDMALSTRSMTGRSVSLSKTNDSKYHWKHLDQFVISVHGSLLQQVPFWH